MSTIRMGWEGWIAFGIETSIGTAVTPTYLWEGEGADSLDLAYQPYPRGPVHGYRATRSGAIRVGHKLPGGQLAPQPLWMNGSSLQLLNILANHFQGSGTAAGSLWTFTRSATQKATATFIKPMTWIKNTAIAGYAEQYLGGIIDSFVVAGQHGGFVTIQPTVKALDGSYNHTGGTGSFTPTTSGMFQFSDLSVTWQGEAIYPSAWSITSNNNIPDLLGPGKAARFGFALGAATGEVSLTVPRDDSEGTLYMSKYITPSIGTLAIAGTLDTAYGTITSGSSIAFGITAYCVPRPYAVPIQAGELTDTVTFDLVEDGAYTWTVRSSATAL